jgi:1-pyrroline-5-carboxylate dehydrogenase
VTTTRLTYTTGTSAEIDEAFEDALAAVRASEPEPLPHLVGGGSDERGALIEREDPARTERVVSRTREGAEVVSDALARARAAAPGWRRLPYGERCGLLRGAARLIGERRIDIAAAMSMEIGKVRTEAIAEVEEAVDLIETYCAQLEANAGFVHELGRLVPDERNRSVLRPYGVFGVIGPFNFPVALATGMSSAALAAGNTVVLKPSEEAPRCGGSPRGCSASSTAVRRRVRRSPTATWTESRSPARPRWGGRSAASSRRARSRAPCSRRWVARTRRS